MDSTRKLLVERLYESGLSITDISRALDIPRTTVWRNLKRRRSISQGMALKSCVSWDSLPESLLRFVLENYSYENAAAILGVPKQRLVWYNNRKLKINKRYS